MYILSFFLSNVGFALGLLLIRYIFLKEMTVITESKKDDFFQKFETGKVVYFSILLKITQ